MNEQVFEAEDNIIDLEERRRIRQATGGGRPPEGGSNWLTDLPNGTRFLAKETGRPGSELDDFVITTPPTSLEAVLLARNIKGRDGVFEWHDPQLFVKNWKLKCILEVVKFDGGDQSIQSERLVGHEDAEEQSGLHEDK